MQRASSAKHGIQAKDDPKILKSYRLRKSVIQRIEKLRLVEGQKRDKIPSAADILEELVLAKNV